MLLLEWDLRLRQEKFIERYGYLSGTDEIRAQDINNMFLDEEVDGIICIRGGYGSPRILELIDYTAIKNNQRYL